MTDNLVKRLRDGCVTGNYEGLEFIEWSKSNATMNEAADRIEALWTVFQETTNKWHDALDRIEALEAALQAFVSYYPMGISLELDQAFRDARAALGDNKND